MLDSINNSLEEKSWFYQESFINDELCDQIITNHFCQDEQGSFFEAKIGNKIKKSENISIRNSSIKWIDQWEESPSLITLNSVLSNIMLSTSRYFRLSLRRFESQFAIYNKGGFYKTHLDQHSGTGHRLISCCIYLNDCVDGGELVIYKKGSKTEVDKIVSPAKGSIVLFFSSDIQHEVKVVKHDSRYSISTWFRNDEVIPFI
jgi:SM-20-related protein